jgi:hypothetical protein
VRHDDGNMRSARLHSSYEHISIVSFSRSVSFEGDGSHHGPKLLTGVPTSLWSTRVGAGSQPPLVEWVGSFALLSSSTCYRACHQVGAVVVLVFEQVLCTCNLFPVETKGRAMDS